ncbi:unnamed protein product [Leptidea sinapis]|uniref:Uncharacterized protein n=1 Tax=Leptidea sinapis TaxID=189913 RepID=A0A5E4QA80_9NEOP|nr:unnamed protein product [Leptidea sinapis]
MHVSQELILVQNIPMDVELWMSDAMKNFSIISWTYRLQNGDVVERRNYEFCIQPREKHVSVVY